MLLTNPKSFFKSLIKLKMSLKKILKTLKNHTICIRTFDDLSLKKI